MKAIAYANIARFGELCGLLLVWLGAGCGSCAGCGDHVAELVEVEADVQRDFAADVRQWQAAEPGATFDLGDGLHTGPGASARLRIFPEGMMHVKPNTTVRFAKAAPGKDTRTVQIEGGAVEVVSEGVRLDVQTAFGITRLDRGSRLRVDRSGTAPRLTLLSGAAVVEEEAGERALSQGQGLLLEGGPAAIEASAAEQAERVEEAEQAEDTKQPEEAEQAEDTEFAAGPTPDLPNVAGPAGVDADPARSEADGPVHGKLDPHPGSPTVSLVGGESATIHDPRPPSRIALSLSECPEGGIVEVATRRRYDHFRARGQGSAVVQLGPGRYRYRLRCLTGGKLDKRPKARGRLRIVRDAATRRLPDRPPSVTVDADGRRYSVRYSNHLPQMTFRWRRPPNASPQTLYLTLQGGQNRTAKASAGGVHFESGDLPEGTHTFYFEAGGARSKQGTLDIEFDNAARGAYLSAPREGSVPRGGPVRLAGGALPGSTLSVNGEPVSLGARGRFSAEVTPSPDHDAIALRLQHRRSGVHYYLRHLSK